MRYQHLLVDLHVVVLYVVVFSSSLNPAIHIPHLSFIFNPVMDIDINILVPFINVWACLFDNTKNRLDHHVVLFKIFCV